MSQQTQQQDDGPSLRVECGIAASFVESVMGAVPDEAGIRFADDGLHTLAVDAANAAMVDTTLTAGVTESFDVETETTVGVNLERLSDILDIPDAGDVISIRLDTETMKLNVAGEGFEYDYATIDPDLLRNGPDLPDLESSTDVTLSVADLERAVSGIEMVDNRVLLQSDGETLQLVGDGDTDDVRFSFDGDGVEAVDALDEFGTYYSLDYSKSLIEAIDGDARLRTPGTELPLRIDTDEDHGPVTFLVAPRVDTR